MEINWNMENFRGYYKGNSIAGFVDLYDKKIHFVMRPYMEESELQELESKITETCNYSLPEGGARVCGRAYIPAIY